MNPIDNKNIVRARKISKKRIIKKRNKIVRTYSLDDFQKKFPQLYRFVKIMRKTNNRFKIVQAPVKSGKRLMVENYSLYDYNPEPNEQTVINIFISALHRKSDENQRKELRDYGIKVFSIFTKTITRECIKFINKCLEENKKVVLHLDELDYGCGDKQLLSKVFQEYVKNDNVFFIKYSATTEVAQPPFTHYPDSIKSQIEVIPKFRPPSTYYGIKNYLDDNRFIQSVNFFHFDKSNNTLELSEQGYNLVDELYENVKKKRRRTLGIIRLAGNFCKGHPKYMTVKDFKEDLLDYFQEEWGKKINLIFAGTDDETIPWDNVDFWINRITTRIPTIIIINQIAGRSTAWKCHPILSWYHTHRTDKTPLSTIIQDQERPVYYIENGKIHNIKIYGDEPSARYSAGYYDIEQYREQTNRKISSRLKVKKLENYDVDIRYYNTWEEIPKKYTKKRRKHFHISDKRKREDGFYYTIIRGEKILYRRKDIKAEGIDDKNKTRLNVFYENDETNGNNYKFVLKIAKDKKEEKDVKNTSMYSLNQAG